MLFIILISLEIFFICFLEKKKNYSESFLLKELDDEFIKIDEVKD